MRPECIGPIRNHEIRGQGREENRREKPGGDQQQGVSVVRLPLPLLQFQQCDQRKNDDPGFFREQCQRISRRRNHVALPPPHEQRDERKKRQGRLVHRRQPHDGFLRSLKYGEEYRGGACHKVVIDYKGQKPPEQCDVGDVKSDIEGIEESGIVAGKGF